MTRGYVGRTFRVNFGYRPERDSQSAARAPRRPLIRRQGERYVSYDADRLLEQDSQSSLARPGHAY